MKLGMRAASPLKRVSTLVKSISNLYFFVAHRKGSWSLLCPEHSPRLSSLADSLIRQEIRRYDGMWGNSLLPTS
jgi:hypothetical protein